MVDLAELVARFASELRAAGLAVGPGRVARFAEAITLVRPRTRAELLACAQATLAYSRRHLSILDSVLAEAPDEDGPSPRGTVEEAGGLPLLGSDVERLRHKDFSTLTADELAALAGAMARLRLATPMRRSRRHRPAAGGARLDLRASLRLAQRTGGEPVRLARRRRRVRPRKLVVLCDISGSMEPYARAMVQLLYCARGTQKAEVFSFATRLTRLTPVLGQQTPATALALAGRAAPDWSGGTTIGSALREFLDRFGRAGMARGAVVLIISDGWETGDATLLGEQMARLRRVAHRIVWANPRTQSPTYQPLVAGMAAAWPHCDTIVSAHSLDALDDLIAAIAGGSGRDQH